MHKPKPMLQHVLAFMLPLPSTLVRTAFALFNGPCTRDMLHALLPCMVEVLSEKDVENIVASRKNLILQLHGSRIDHNCYIDGLFEASPARTLCIMLLRGATPSTAPSRLLRGSRMIALLSFRWADTHHTAVVRACHIPPPHPNRHPASFNLASLRNWGTQYRLPNSRIPF